MQHEELTEKIIGCAITVHSTLGPGFLESVYQRALAHEFGKAGIRFETDIPLTVIYEDVVVGEFEADMLVENFVMVENKAAQALSVAHEVQLVNYLNATRTDIGLLLNFGAARLEFKRKYRAYRQGKQDSTKEQD